MRPAWWLNSPNLYNAMMIQERHPFLFLLLKPLLYLDLNLLLLCFNKHTKLYKGRRGLAPFYLFGGQCHYGIFEHAKIYASF